MLNSFKKLTKVFTEASPQARQQGGRTEDDASPIVTVVAGPQQQVRRPESPAATANRTAEVLSLLQSTIAQSGPDRYSGAASKGAPTYTLSQVDFVGINTSAGFELLRIYEARWRAINARHRMAADKARAVRVKCGPVRRYCELVWQTLDDAEKTVSRHLPELVLTMRGICKSLEALRVSMHAVEHGLGELEAARDEADTQRGVAKATADLDAYRADKRRQYEAAKGDYESCLRRIELDKREREARMLADKQAEYEQRHRMAMDAYRTGSPKPAMLGSSNTSVGIDPATSSVSRLEDVDIRDIIGGDKDLDDFFKDVDSDFPTVVTRNKTKTLSDSEDET